MTYLRAREVAAAGAALTLVAEPETWGQRAPGTGSTWNGWLWVVIVITITAAIGIWVLLARRQRLRSRRTYRLEISNLGNVCSRYELRAEDPAHAFQFAFVLDGARLYGRTATEPAQDGASPPPQLTPAAATPAPQPSGKALQAKGWAMRAGSVAASVLSTLGALLPRSAGGPLLRVAGQIRRGGGSVRRAERLTRQAGQLRPAPAPKATPLRRRTERSPQGRPTRPSTGAEAAPAAARSDAAAQTWVQTPFVEAGETVAIDLLISPTNPYQTAYYPFTVTSRSLEAPDAPLIAEEGSVHVAGLTLFQHFGPFLVALTIALTLLFIVSLFIGNGP